MKLFAQIQKVDEEKRLVYGRASDETPDKSGESMNYDGSKPHFMKWSADISADTDGKSLGNVRAMHGKVAAGKLTDIAFDDSARTIDVCAKIVDNNEWNKVLEGVYTGFSIGGSYGDKTVEKVDGHELTRYVAIPNEVSLVDRPCNPNAKFFQVQKVDGSIDEVEFKEAEVVADDLSKVDDQQATNDAVEDIEVSGSPEEIIAFGKLMNEQNLSMAQVIEMVKASKAETAAKTDEPIAKVATPKELRKGLYGCARFIELIESMKYLQESAEWEAYYEGDGSQLPNRLNACLSLCASVLKEMLDEELAELTEGGEAGESAVPMAMAEKCGEIAKCDADPLMTLIKIGARNSGADAQHIKSIHDAAVSLGADCATVDKSDTSGDMAKVHQETLEKALATAIEPLNKMLAEANEKIQKLEAQPAVQRVSLRAVSKAEDGGDMTKEKTEADLVKDDHGTVHPAASLIKQLQENGGQPLVYRG